MTTQTTKELSTQVSSQTLAALKSEFPQETRRQNISLPRLSLVSQDITQDVVKAGKKRIEIITEAGTFMEETKSEEFDSETGKPVWIKTELGTSIEGIIVYQRKQLRYYDEVNEVYTSSPVYDTSDEVVPLFCEGAEVDRGTTRELQARYPQGVTAGGKPKAKLEENKVLYILYNDTPYQLTIRGSSMYSFMEYARGTTPPSVVTTLSSEPQEKGSIKWHKMTFAIKRHLDGKEAERVLAIIRDIKQTIAEDKAQYTEVVPAAVTKEDF